MHADRRQPVPSRRERDASAVAVVTWRKHRGIEALGIIQEVASRHETTRDSVGTTEQESALRDTSDGGRGTTVPLRPEALELLSPALLDRLASLTLEQLELTGHALHHGATVHDCLPN